MTKEKPQTLENWVVELCENDADLRKRGAGKRIHELATAAGWNCSPTSINHIRTAHGLSNEDLDTPLKRKRRAATVRKLRNAAKAKRESKLPAKAKARAKAKAEPEYNDDPPKASRAKAGVTTHPGSSTAPAHYSEHDRDFLQALRLIGTTRAQELVELATFLGLLPQ